MGGIAAWLPFDCGVGDEGERGDRADSCKKRDQEACLISRGVCEDGVELCWCEEVAKMIDAMQDGTAVRCGRELV